MRGKKELISLSLLVAKTIQVIFLNLIYKLIICPLVIMNNNTSQMKAIILMKVCKTIKDVNRNKNNNILINIMKVLMKINNLCLCT